MKNSHDLKQTTLLKSWQKIWTDTSLKRSDGIQPHERCSTSLVIWKCKLSKQWSNKIYLLAKIKR